MNSIEQGKAGIIESISSVEICGWLCHCHRMSLLTLHATTLSSSILVQKVTICVIQQLHASGI
jgi:hypothetical protein